MITKECGDCVGVGVSVGAGVAVGGAVAVGTGVALEAHPVIHIVKKTNRKSSFTFYFFMSLFPFQVALRQPRNIGEIPVFHVVKFGDGVA